ncbi:MAG TPA: M20/M25/M40 family metallo-hydrolase [Cyclobacteriaceae bacterium]|jgi:acetylornithine deacetylase/succinyl-diaminopimelate desuccinylase-like protein|nr:M20/M25/M40 family metallo-hydrolase [Cyclobacteriaceae bacterium]
MKRCSALLLSVLVASVISAQQKAKTKKTEYEQQVIDLAKNKLVKDAFAFIDQLEPITRQEHIALTQVAAPPFKEEKRAQHFKKMLEAAKADKVWIDSLGNVLALRKGLTGARTVVLDAHLDTVFPEGTDVTVKQKGDTLFAPGIADDTRGLIAILTVLKAMQKTNLMTNDDVLFIGTVGEEGLGDLRGVKYILEKSKIKVDSWIAVDGTEIDHIVNGALGSVRYRATINGPGGHSWGAFGLGNPHSAMAKSLNYFSDEAARFTTSGIKTSFNIGRTGGGTSVNSIPFESWAEIDMRSEGPSHLKKMDSIFKASMKKGVDEYNLSIKKGPALTLILQQIGNRPSGVTQFKHPLVQRAVAALSHFTQVPPKFDFVSTNANTPIAHGIPAICIGAGGRSEHEHSLEEWWINEKGADGVKFVLLTLLMEAGITK